MMFRRAALFILPVLQVATLSALTPPEETVTAPTQFVPSVFVSVPTRDGFVDAAKDVQDSVGDIKGRLSGAREVRLVERREAADIVLTVVARGVGSQAFGQRLTYTQYFNDAVLTSMPVLANTWWVTTVIDVGSYRKEMTGAYTHPPGLAYFGGAWTECAKRVAEDLKTWVQANIDQLRQRNAEAQFAGPRVYPLASEASLAELSRLYPDWRSYEAKMRELAASVTRANGSSEIDHLIRLYRIAKGSLTPAPSGSLR